MYLEYEPIYAWPIRVATNAAASSHSTMGAALFDIRQVVMSEFSFDKGRKANLF
jgi:hypothetical protein